MKHLNDPDAQKNLSTLATKIAELQEQNRLTQGKINDFEKRSTIFMRERDQALLENGRLVASKSKLESLCRDLTSNIINKFEYRKNNFLLQNVF